MKEIIFPQDDVMFAASNVERGDTITVREALGIMATNAAGLVARYIPGLHGPAASAEAQYGVADSQNQAQSQSYKDDETVRVTSNGSVLRIVR